MQQIGFLLQNLLFARRVSGTIMPIIRSSRFIQMVAACGTWRTRPTTCKPKRQVPQAATIRINLELLMMGIMVPETRRANSKFCNKKPICCIWLALYVPCINDDAWSNSYHVYGSLLGKVQGQLVRCCTILFSRLKRLHCLSSQK